MESLEQSALEQNLNSTTRKCAYCGKEGEFGTYVNLFQGSSLALHFKFCSECVHTAIHAINLGKEVTQEWAKGNRRILIAIESHAEEQQLDETLSLKEWTALGLEDIA